MIRGGDGDVCVVTGGAGFIGLSIIDGLLERFSRVIIIDIMHPQVHQSSMPPSLYREQIEFIHADIADPETWNNLLTHTHPALIVHLAAETGTGQSLTESFRHTHNNVSGTAVMLDAFVRHNVIPKRILLASSRAVYGEGAWRKNDGTIYYPGQRTRAQLARADWDFPDSISLQSKASETIASPISVYGATKLAQENLLSSWALSFGVALAVLRLQNVYGPGQSLINSYTGILSLFCRIARDGHSIPLYEDGNMLRDFVLITDVSEAILATLDHDLVSAVTYDIGTGESISIADMARRIADGYHAPEPHICGKFRYGDVRHASCRIDSATKEIGWVPRHTLDQGVEMLISWVENQLGSSDDNKF